MSGQMKMFRSLLFVPGSRPERFEKAIASGADAVCIDLEDAVPPQDKAAARIKVLDWLSTQGEFGCAVGIRINGLDTVDGLRDVVALADTGVLPDFIMVPKAAASSDLWNLQSMLGLRPINGKTKRVAVWAVVETVLGLKNASDLAGSCGHFGGILFGGADFSAAIGTNMDWEALFHARSTLATQCRITSGTLLDVPFLDVKDEAGLRGACERVKALGFNGKACIHPSQVGIVNEVFSPTQAEIDWARRVREANLASTGNALLLDGKLLDAPVYLRAERILNQAGIEI
jgi:citrate lyase beta subunit